MIDIMKLKAVLKGYASYFPTHWDDEKYKWEAIKHFQTYWDMDAPDFGEMFKQATAKTYNLLASGYAYPRSMITTFAMADDEAVRHMFQNLFDESTDLAERVAAFQEEAEALRVKYDDGTWRKHHQNTNAISTYLWLMYPDKYYIYRYEIYRDVAKELQAEYRPKRNGSVDILIGGFEMYNEICDAISKESEITELLNHALNDTCYADPEYKTLTIDIGFYLSRYYVNENKVDLEEASQDALQVETDASSHTSYTKQDFLSAVFMTEARYDVLEALLKNKKNVILQGAPGVGKTFVAKKLAYAMMGEMDDSRIELIQFHQNYSYEDFIMGYRPDGADFKLTEGIFYRFCQKAAADSDRDYFFIIG